LRDSTEKSELETKRKVFQTELTGHRNVLEQYQAQYEGSQSRLQEEEQRLSQEESKILERRKQLTAIGGAKVARIVEREIEIASKALEALEANVKQARHESDRLSERIVDLKATVDAMESQYSAENSDEEARLAELEKTISSEEK